MTRLSLTIATMLTIAGSGIAAAQLSDWGAGAYLVFNQTQRTEVRFDGIPATSQSFPVRPWGFPQSTAGGSMSGELEGQVYEGTGWSSLGIGGGQLAYEASFSAEGSGPARWNSWMVAGTPSAGGADYYMVTNPSGGDVRLNWHMELDFDVWHRGRPEVFANMYAWAQLDTGNQPTEYQIYINRGIRDSGRYRDEAVGSITVSPGEWYRTRVHFKFVGLATYNDSQIGVGGFGTGTLWVEILTPGAKIVFASDIESIPLECPATAGSGPARWLTWQTDSLAVSQTTNPASAGYVDCTKPFFLIFHGWTGSPDDVWIADTAAGIRAQVPDANVLVADAQTLMNPTGFTWSMAGLRGPSFIGPMIRDLAGAWSNISEAGEALAQHLECLNCGTPPSIPLVIAHSFGGPIATRLCARLRQSGIAIGTLVSLDSPWRVPLIGSNWLPEETGLAGNCPTGACRHVNIFSTAWYAGGFGTPLNKGHTINLQKDRELLLGCTLNLRHNCLPEQFAAWFASPEGWNQVNCGHQPGTFLHEEGAQWNWVPGAGPPPPMPPGEAYGLTTIIDAVDHIIDDQLIDVIDDFGLDFLRVGDEIHITTSGNELPGLAYGRYTMPADAGFLAFEYQISDLAPDEIVSVSFADKLLWSAYTDTPAGVWQTAVIYVGSLAERTESLIFALNPGNDPAPNDMLKLRNIRLHDNRIFLDFAGGGASGPTTPIGVQRVPAP